jgi:hypothetical protein
MIKPHLEILSEADDVLLRGRCSACPTVTFSLPHTTESSLSLIHGMFSEHFREVHDRQDAPKRSDHESPTPASERNTGT